MVFVNAPVEFFRRAFPFFYGATCREENNNTKAVVKTAPAVQSMTSWPGYFIPSTECE
jgi:hypothetical protein